MTAPEAARHETASQASARSSGSKKSAAGKAKRKLSMSSQQSGASSTKKKPPVTAATAATAAALAKQQQLQQQQQQRSNGPGPAMQAAGVKRKRQGEKKPPLAARQKKMNAKLLDFLGKRKALMAQREVQVARVSKLRASLGTAMAIQPEAQRTRSHWDSLLEEMMWMATDFIEERKFKGSVVARLAYSAKVQHAERQVARELTAKRLEERHQSISDLVATHVGLFWDAHATPTSTSSAKSSAIAPCSRLRNVPDRSERLEATGAQGAAALDALRSEADQDIDEKLAALVEKEGDIENLARRRHAAALALAQRPRDVSSIRWLKVWGPPQGAGGLREKATVNDMEVDEDSKAPEIVDNEAHSDDNSGDDDEDQDQDDGQATQRARLHIARLMEGDDDDDDRDFSLEDEEQLVAVDEDSIAEQERLFPEGDDLGASELLLLARDIERSAEDVAAEAMRPHLAKTLRGPPSAEHRQPGSEPVDAADVESSNENEPPVPDDREDDQDIEMADIAENGKPKGKSKTAKNKNARVKDDNDSNDEDDDMEEDDDSTDISIEELAGKLPTIPQKDLTARVKAYAALARAVRAACKGRSKNDPVHVPPRLMPASALESFFPHQEVALDWLASMHKQRLGAVLADDRGLGKEAVVVAFLALLAGEAGAWGPHLIVTTPARAFQWRLHILQYCPGLRVTRKVLPSVELQPAVTILTQEEAAANEALLCRRSWHTLVWDLVDINREDPVPEPEEDEATAVDASAVASPTNASGAKDEDAEAEDEDDAALRDPEVVLRRLPLLRSTVRLVVTANEAEAKANATKIAYFLLPFVFLGSSSKEKQWASKKSANAWRDCVQAFTLSRRAQSITGIDDVDVDRETKNFGPTLLQSAYKGRLLSAYNKLVQKLTPRGNRDTKTRHLGIYSMCLFAVGCHPDSIFPRKDRCAFAMTAIAAADVSTQSLAGIARYPWQMRVAQFDLFESVSPPDSVARVLQSCGGITVDKFAAAMRSFGPVLLAGIDDSDDGTDAQATADPTPGQKQPNRSLKKSPTTLTPWKPSLSRARPPMNPAQAAALDVSAHSKSVQGHMANAMREKLVAGIVPTEPTLPMVQRAAVVAPCVSVLGAPFAESSLHMPLRTRPDPRPELSGMIKSLPGVLRRLMDLDFGSRKLLLVAHDPALLLPAQAVLTASRIRYIRVEAASSTGALSLAVRQLAASTEVRILMAAVQGMDALLGAEMELEHGLGLISAVVVLDEPGVGCKEDPLTDRIDAIALAHARRRSLRGEPEQVFYVEDLQVDFNLAVTTADDGAADSDASAEGASAASKPRSQPKIMELSEVTAALERVRKRTNEESLDLLVKQSIDEFLGRASLKATSAALPMVGARTSRGGSVVWEERDISVEDLFLRAQQASTGLSRLSAIDSADSDDEDEGEISGLHEPVAADPLLAGFMRTADHSFEDDDDEDEDDEDEDEEEEEADATESLRAQVEDLLRKSTAPLVRRAQDMLREPGSIIGHMSRFQGAQRGASLLVVDTRKLRKELFVPSPGLEEAAADDAQSSASLASVATTRPAEALMSDATWLNQTDNYEPLFYNVDPRLSKSANMERLLMNLEKDTKVVGASVHVYAPPYEPSVSGSGAQQEEALPSAPPMLGFQASQLSSAGNGFSGGAHATSGMPQRPKFAVSFIKQRMVAMNTDPAALEFDPVKRRSASIDDDGVLKKRKLDKKSARAIGSSGASSGTPDPDADVQGDAPSELVRLDSTIDVDVFQEDEDEAPGLAPAPSSTAGKDVDWGVHVPKVKPRLKGAQKKTAAKNAGEEEPAPVEVWTAWEDAAMLRAVEVFGPSWDLVQHLTTRPMMRTHTLQQIIDRYHVVRSKYKTAAGAPWVAKHERSVREIAPWATPPLHKTDLLLYAPAPIRAFEAAAGELAGRPSGNDFVLRRRAGLPLSLGRKGYSSYPHALALPDAAESEREKCSKLFNIISSAAAAASDSSHAASGSSALSLLPFEDPLPLNMRRENPSQELPMGLVQHQGPFSDIVRQLVNRQSEDSQSKASGGNTQQRRSGGGGGGGAAGSYSGRPVQGRQMAPVQHARHSQQQPQHVQTHSQQYVHSKAVPTSSRSAAYSGAAHPHTQYAQQQQSRAMMHSQGRPVPQGGRSPHAHPAAHQQQYQQQRQRPVHPQDPRHMHQQHGAYSGSPTGGSYGQHGLQMQQQPMSQTHHPQHQQRHPQAARSSQAYAQQQRLQQQQQYQQQQRQQQQLRHPSTGSSGSNSSYQ